MKLKALESRGLIANLRRQVPFPLVVNGVKATTYRADFVWFEVSRGTCTQEVVADAKGYPTETYKIKKALMKAIHGIEIREL